MIDHKYRISKYFRLGEFTKLRMSGTYAQIDYRILRNIIELSDMMDKIRELFDKPIIVTSGYRPEGYNKAIGGAKRSKHISGRACDFVVLDGREVVSCDLVRKKLKPLCEVYGFSMEDLPGSGWVHIDLDKRRDKYRFFKP